MTNFKMLIINAKENNRVCKPLKPLRIYFRPQDEISALIFFLAHLRPSTIQCASLDEITHPGIMNEETVRDKIKRSDCWKLIQEEFTNDFFGFLDSEANNEKCAFLENMLDALIKFYRKDNPQGEDGEAILRPYKVWKKIRKLQGLVSINDIVTGEPLPFFIPRYQRGYRWTETQVKQFCEDIYQTPKGKWNCIQPLVVKVSNGRIEVIDGQQRLTTIYLILKVLEKGPGFTLEYETREKSQEFLKEIGDESENESKDNIDFSRMFAAYKAIKEFCEKTDTDKKQFGDNLLERTKFIWYEPEGNEDSERLFSRLNTGKIPLTDAELIKATLLNKNNFQGEKSSESNEYVQRRQFEIASEWDDMENSLHDEAFWCFLFDPVDKDRFKGVRLDVIFELWARKDDEYKKKYEEIYGEHAVWKAVDDKLNPKKDDGKTNESRGEGQDSEKSKTPDERATAFWAEIRKLYGTLQTWYRDPEIYHYLGYLLCKEEDTIKMLVKYIGKWEGGCTKKGASGITNTPIAIGKWEGRCTKKEFVDKVLKKEVKKDTEGLADYINDSPNSEGRFDYGEERVRPVLLLHNVLTYLKRLQVAGEQYDTLSPIRFPFNLYKREDWDVEHIASRTPNDLTDRTNQINWLLAVYDFIQDNKLRQNIEEYVKKDSSDDNDFANLKNEILGKNKWLESQGENSDKDALANLVLLDRRTNRQYKNSIFPLKRQWILAKERGEKITALKLNKGKIDKETISFPDNAYILPCTKDVFTKSYNEHMDHGLEWTREDGKRYLKRMKEIFDHFGLLNEEQN